VSKLFSQHLLGTTVIDIHSDKKANSTMYFQATLLGDPYSLGSVVVLYGFYADELMKNAKGEWLI
jgi:hypothetical protein